MNFRTILTNCIVAGSVTLSCYLVKKHEEIKQNGLENRVETLSDHFQLLNHWLELKTEGKSISSYFEEMGYFHIAIYGMAELANRLSDDLADSNISIDYGIDRDISCTITRMKEVYYPEDDLPKTDAIVVTSYSSFESIKRILEPKVTCPIISLEEVIWSV